MHTFKKFHWIAVLISLVATLVAWQLSLSGVKNRTLIQFDLQADYAVDLFMKQMRRHADVLRESAGLVVASDTILADEWRSFTLNLKLEDKFPAISGIGVAYRTPRGSIDEFQQTQRRLNSDFTIRSFSDSLPESLPPYALPITYFSPDSLAPDALGLDLVSEARRREAIEMAVKSGIVHIATLERSAESGSIEFVLAAPIYPSELLDAQGTALEDFIGAIVARVSVESLANGLIDSKLRQVALRVSDGAAVLFDELTDQSSDAEFGPGLSEVRTVNFFGRDWLFDIHSTLQFHQSNSSNVPVMILISGLTLNGMLLVFSILMARSRQQVETFGVELSTKYELQAEKLRQSKAALEERNEELKSFSYIVSHDLKAPLRCIDLLTQCVQEDISAYLPKAAADNDIADVLKRIRLQVKQSQGLIISILKFSDIGSETIHPEVVDFTELLTGIRETLGVEESQLQLAGHFPEFETYHSQLLQVFTNLIGNGYKYYDGDALAIVTVSVVDSPLSGFQRFTVTDNGPGIDPKHHAKIFEVFSTLQPKDHSLSSGLGLFIVKKLVRQYGGEVSLDSEVGQGSSFIFDWPIVIDDQSDIDVTANLPKAA